MASAWFGTLVHEEAARQGVDAGHHRAVGLAAAEIAQDTSIDPERRALAFELAIASGEVIAGLVRVALERRAAA